MIDVAVFLQVAGIVGGLRSPSTLRASGSIRRIDLNCKARLALTSRPNNYQASPRQADRSLSSGRRPKPKKRASERGR